MLKLLVILVAILLSSFLSVMYLYFLLSSFSSKTEKMNALPKGPSASERS